MDLTIYHSSTNKVNMSAYLSMLLFYLSKLLFFFKKIYSRSKSLIKEIIRRILQKLIFLYSCTVWKMNVLSWKFFKLHIVHIVCSHAISCDAFNTHVYTQRSFLKPCIYIQERERERERERAVLLWIIYLHHDGAFHYCSVPHSICVASILYMWVGLSTKRSCTSSECQTKRQQRRCRAWRRFWFEVGNFISGIDVNVLDANSKINDASQREFIVASRPNVALSPWVSTLCYLF